MPSTASTAESASRDRTTSEGIRAAGISSRATAARTSADPSSNVAGETPQTRTTTTVATRRTASARRTGPTAGGVTWTGASATGTVGTFTEDSSRLVTLPWHRDRPCPERAFRPAGARDPLDSRRRRRPGRVRDGPRPSRALLRRARHPAGRRGHRPVRPATAVQGAAGADDAGVARRGSALRPRRRRGRPAPRRAGDRAHGLRHVRRGHELVRDVPGRRRRARVRCPGTKARRLGVGCLLYTSDAADDLLCVDLGGRRIIKKK